jgi:hypothetical protein
VCVWGGGGGALLNTISNRKKVFLLHYMDFVTLKDDTQKYFIVNMVSK